MLNYFINAISRSLSFSKTESKGTILLIFVMLCSIILMKWKINRYQNIANTTQDSTALAWITDVQSAYELKKEKEQVFDKSVYQPKTNYKKYIPEKKKAVARIEKPKVEIIIQDLNLATAEDLQMVKGIGPAYSERIIKYRNLLGGFADSSQLREVYGLTNETIDKLYGYFQIQSEVHQLDLNTDSIKHLARHPYISYDLARIIINYRKQHGDILTSEDLSKIKALDEGTFLRLKPYLK